jgi:hypothetical protein
MIGGVGDKGSGDENDRALRSSSPDLPIPPSPTQTFPAGFEEGR